MLKTCEGSYHGGVVVLKEQPEGLNSGPVLVTFLPSGDVISSDSGVADGLGQAIEEARSLFRAIVEFSGWRNKSMPWTTTPHWR